MATAAVDNDILFKGACYRLVDKLVTAIPSTATGVGVLGAAKYVVSSKIRKTKLAQGAEHALGCLEGLFQSAEVLEPSLDEQLYAAELEASAQQLRLQFDTGESQLCAIVMTRAIPWLATGDKRAIRALERLLAPRDDASRVANRVVCLEQLLLRLLAAQDATAIRSAVCSEPAIDKALTACFSCYSAEVNADSWSEGLTSYIRDLRSSAPRMLAQ